MGVKEDMFLELIDVSHTFETKNKTPRTVIEKISLKAFRGKSIVILGPSGCGKSTILRMIAGLIEPTSGKIIFKDKQILGPSSSRCLVFQNYACFPFLTVEQNISFGLSIKGWSKPQIQVKVESLLETMGLCHLKKEYPNTLSGGERQRAAIARSIAVQPKLLLMDEPFSSLDGVMRRNLQDLVLTLGDKDGINCVFVTHSVEEAIYLGSVVYIMSAGPTEQRTAPASIIGKVPVSFSAKRTQEIKFSKEFEEIEREINELLRTRAYE